MEARKTYIAANNDFAAVGIHEGDTLIFDGAKPGQGDFTLLTSNGEYRLVWLLGYDWLGKPILCRRFNGYPEALSLSCEVKLVGRLAVKGIAVA